MSLNLGQIRARVQLNLNDAVGTFFDNATVNQSVQDGYDEVLVDTQCAEGTASVPFQSSVLYYDLYNGIIPPNQFFWRISRIFNQNTNRWMPCVDSRVLDKFRFDWEAANGTPWFGYIVNFQYLGFFPHYTSGTAKSFDILYKVGKDYLTTDAQIPQIPDEFSRILESYATADLLEIYREFTKAADYWDDYFKLKQKLIDYMPSRSMPDRFLQQNDLDWPNFWSPA